jgi:hypothetical protein
VLPDSPLSSRWASDEADARAVFEVLKDMHCEVGRASLNHAKALAWIGAIVDAGLARIVTRGDRIVATFGLDRMDWWFGDEEAFFSRWFYVAPEERTGNALRILLDDAFDLVEDERIPAYLHVYNHDAKHPRSVKRLEHIADEISVLPTGRILVIDRKE